MKIRNKLVFGVAINDYEGKVMKSGVVMPEYRLWKNMLNRCFGKSYKNRQKSYDVCLVCDDWLKFSTFISDIRSMFNYDKFINDDWHLDKDLLVKGNKVYSKDTCCFIPREVNSCLTNRKNKRGPYPLGVSFCGKNYMSRSHDGDGNSVYLGRFDSVEDAFKAYRSYKVKVFEKLAERYKNLFPDNVYDALSGREVSIND